MEVRRLARHKEVPDVAAGDQDLSARFRAVLTLFIGDDEELDRGFTPQLVQVLDGVHEGGEGALHVVDATTVELISLLARLELRLLARHHVNVAVQEYPWISCPHPHHESRLVTAGPSARIARRLQPARPEPAIDKVQRRLRRARRVRSVAHELAGKCMDLSVLGYYRQMILHSSDADERDVFYMLFELASTLRPAWLVSPLRPSTSAFSTLRAFSALALSPQLLPFGSRPAAHNEPLTAAVEFYARGW